jgi:hypothetical protein
MDAMARTIGRARDALTERLRREPYRFQITQAGERAPRPGAAGSGHALWARPRPLGIGDTPFFSPRSDTVTGFPAWVSRGQVQLQPLGGPNDASNAC